jgi:hypothetical protein
LRRLATYGFNEEDRIPREVAESMFLKATRFVGMAENFLGGQESKEEKG